jgi:hypothetical protein
MEGSNGTKTQILRLGAESEGLDEAERARLFRFVRDKLGAEPA